MFNVNENLDGAVVAAIVGCATVAGVALVAGVDVGTAVLLTENENG